MSRYVECSDLLFSRNHQICVPKKIRNGLNVVREASSVVDLIAGSKTTFCNVLVIDQCVRLGCEILSE